MLALMVTRGCQIPLKLELQAVVSQLTWVLGTEVGSSVGAVYSATH